MKYGGGFSPSRSRVRLRSSSVLIASRMGRRGSGDDGAAALSAVDRTEASRSDMEEIPEPSRARGSDAQGPLPAQLSGWDPANIEGPGSLWERASPHHSTGQP